MRSTLLSILLLRKIRGRWSFLWSFQCTAMDMMIWRIRFTQIFCRPSVGIMLILCRSFRWMVQVRTASPSSTVFATSTTSVCYLALLVCNGTFGYLFGNLRSHGSPWQILISRAIQFLSRCNVAKYFQYYECCYLYQVATILQAITLSEGAQVIQVLQAFLYCLGSSSCQVCFKLPWVEAIVKQCLSWSLHIHFAAELSLYLLVACLLCPHYLLTLCSWKPSSLTAVSPFECSACPSNVRVGVDGMSVHGSKSPVVHPAIQALSFVKQSIALSPSLLWISVLEGAFYSILVLQSVKPSVLEIFLLIIQVFERLINLSTAIHFPDSVRKMRESCPGLTEQTPKGLTERSEVFRYDPMHECCQARAADTYNGLLFTAIKMGLYTHFGMQQRSSYSIVRLNMWITYSADTLCDSSDRYWIRTI